MGTSVDVVKRGGRRATESFAREKLHKSIVTACLSLHTPAGQAESIANKVCDYVIAWAEDKSEITSRDIRSTATRHLNAHHPEAAYMYEQYLITI